MTERLLRTGQALQKALEGHKPILVNSPASKPAAVLMPLWDDGKDIQVIFTKRSSQLPHHGGQISFPGGMKDPEDANTYATALRETHEEIGIDPNYVKKVARLDQTVTITDFLITPYVGLVADNVSFITSPAEVERLIIAPLNLVLDQSNYKPTEINWQGWSFKQRALNHNGDLIWGATARILLNLLDALGNRAASVIQASI